MKERNDVIWSAYLDGELSASEASRFDQSLTAAERGRLADEVRFEGALADVLRRDSACPPAVWERVQSAVRESANAKVRSNIFLRPVGWRGALAAAAVFFLVVAGIIIKIQNAPSSIIELGDKNTTQMAATSAVAQGDLASVNNYLLAHGFALNVHPDANGFNEPRHGRKLLGVRERDYEGTRVMEVLFNCCGQPIKVVLAPKDSAAADEITKAAHSGDVQETRVVGDYVVASIGRHHAGGVLKYFGTASADATQRA